jgi:hypothetical protein
MQRVAQACPGMPVLAGRPRTGAHPGAPAGARRAALSHVLLTMCTSAGTLIPSTGGLQTDVRMPQELTGQALGLQWID